jgi:hypothetical protein
MAATPDEVLKQLKTNTGTAAVVAKPKSKTLIFFFNGGMVRASTFALLTEKAGAATSCRYDSSLGLLTRKFVVSGHARLVMVAFF